MYIHFYQYIYIFIARERERKREIMHASLTLGHLRACAAAHTPACKTRLSLEIRAPRSQRCLHRLCTAVEALKVFAVSCHPLAVTKARVHSAYRPRSERTVTRNSSARTSA